MDFLETGCKTVGLGGPDFSGTGFTEAAFSAAVFPGSAPSAFWESSAFSWQVGALSVLPRSRKVMLDELLDEEAGIVAVTGVMRRRISRL